ncbi:MAG TPA: hypothetical protein VFY23_15150 [Candidatus Limnocylindrales bacterium]|nr:hypothetical protein [Candidatus Limnocylindrales bacterium]
MNASERIGQQLPELLEELALPRVPGYFDDLLQATAAARQQPSWASRERWFPVASVTRPAPFGLPSWQPILLVAALLLAAAVGGVLIVGSQPRVPAPFGPAENGVLLASTRDGTVVAIDPDTAQASDFGPSGERYVPWYSPDGARMLFMTKDAAGAMDMLYIGNADGSDARPVLDASTLGWVEWSPSGRQVFARDDPGPDQQAWLIDATTLEKRALDFGDIEVHEAFFRQNGDLVFLGYTGPPRTTWAIYTTPLPEVSPEPLTSPTGIQLWNLALSPDGSTIAYPYNDIPAGIRSEIHTIDLETGDETPLALAGFDRGEADLDPWFSPDGQWLLVNRYDDVAPLGRPVIVRVDGTGDEIRLRGGPAVDEDTGYESHFSPDGRYVVVRYNEDNSVWIYDATTGEGRQVQGLTAEGLTWQRRAP